MIKHIWVLHEYGDNGFISFKVGEGGVEKIEDLPNVFIVNYKDRFFYLNKSTAKYWEVTFDQTN